MRVLPIPLNDGHMFAVRRLQELGRKVRVPRLLCFIDPQKAYESVGFVEDACFPRRSSDLACIQKQPPKVGPETALECVRLAF